MERPQDSGRNCSPNNSKNTKNSNDRNSNTSNSNNRLNTGDDNNGCRGWMGRCYDASLDEGRVMEMLRIAQNAFGSLA